MIAASLCYSSFRIKYFFLDSEKIMKVEAFKQFKVIQSHLIGDIFAFEVSMRIPSVFSAQYKASTLDLEL